MALPFLLRLAMAKGERGWLIHAGAGAIVGGFFVIGLLTVLGVGREWLQHPGDLALSLHQWAEALAWPAGALLVIVAVLIVVRVRKGRW